MTKSRSTWGSKRKRGDAWELRYTVAGKRRTESFHGSASEADARLAELRVQYEQVTELMTLDAFWSTYYLPEARERLAESTVARYTDHYLRDIKPRFGDMAMRDIHPRDIQAWLDGMTSGKARIGKRILSAVLGRAYALEYIDDNPAQRRFVYPTARANGQRSKKIYSLEELIQVYNACTGEIWEAVFILSAFAGASLSEAMSVKLSEIMEVDDYVVAPILRSVQHIQHPGEKGVVKALPKPKNEYRERELVVPPPYSHRLMELVDAGVKRGDVWLTDDGFGEPVDPSAITRYYRKWFCTQPMCYVPFGNLRHSYGTLLETAGADGLMASKMMGHAQPTTFYKHYLRPKIEDKIKLLEQLVLS